MRIALKVADLRSLALIGIDAEIEKYEQNLAVLRRHRASLVNGSKSPRTVELPKRKRVLSADARERIRRAQIKRWRKKKQLDKALAREGTSLKA